MNDPKETNPKLAMGTRKVPFSTLPSEVLAELGLAFMEGALKYGRHNYRSAGARASTYYDALMRHMTAWWEGQDVDPDSGESHLVKAMACLVIMRDCQITGHFTDDRPPSLPDNWQVELNRVAGELIDKYPNPVDAHIKVQP